MDYITLLEYYAYMNSCFISQILVLFLELICLSRIFFVKTSKVDSPVILSPISFVISIINILIFGFSSFSFYILILAFFILITNLRSTLRFCANLYVDNYSIPFLIFTFIELIFTVFLVIFVFIYRPVNIRSEDFDSTKKVEIISGSYLNQFSIEERTNLSVKKSGFLYTYENQNPQKLENSNDLPIILFAGNCFGEVSDYEPLLYFLSQKGFCVLAADFYSDDIKYLKGNISNSKIFRKKIASSLYFENLNDKENFTEEIKIFEEKQVLSYEGLINLAKQKFGEEKEFFILCDGIDFETQNEILRYSFENITDIFAIDSIPEYKTARFGFVEQTNVFIAKKFNLARDKTLFIPRYVSNKITDRILSFTASGKDSKTQGNLE